MNKLSTNRKALCNTISRYYKSLVLFLWQLNGILSLYCCIY